MVIVDLNFFFDYCFGLELELGGDWCNFDDCFGLELELGGELWERGVYVDEVICIGCKNCVYVVFNIFIIEQEYGCFWVFS